MTRIPGFRWRIVPAFLCGVFGAASLIGGVGRVGMMSLGYYRHGLVAISPDTPSTNLFAISTRNVSSVIATILAGVVLLGLGIRLWPRWHGREITR